jgi:hypothetical protein
LDSESEPKSAATMGSGVPGSTWSTVTIRVGDALRGRRSVALR